MKKILLISALLASGLMAAEAPAAFKKCIACHGADAKMIAPGSKGNVKIAGLPKEKLLADLKGYKAKTADNGGAKAIMYAQMATVSDGDIEALATYISGLK